MQTKRFNYEIELITKSGIVDRNLERSKNVPRDENVWGEKSDRYQESVKCKYQA